jgi:hypothetical protein
MWRLRVRSEAAPGKTLRVRATIPKTIQSRMALVAIVVSWSLVYGSHTMWGRWRWWRWWHGLWWWRRIGLLKRVEPVRRRVVTVATVAS